MGGMAYAVKIILGEQLLPFFVLGAEITSRIIEHIITHIKEAIMIMYKKLELIAKIIGVVRYATGK